MYTFQYRYNVCVFCVCSELSSVAGEQSVDFTATTDISGPLTQPSLLPLSLPVHLFLSLPLPLPLSLSLSLPVHLLLLFFFLSFSLLLSLPLSLPLFFFNVCSCSQLHLRTLVNCSDLSGDLPSVKFTHTHTHTLTNTNTHTLTHSLKELHLTNNGYSTVTFDPSFTHASLNTLHINNNSISQWAELEKLSHAFPNLYTLVAISNPLQNISIVDSTFPSLQQLTLSSTQISDWTSIE